MKLFFAFGIVGSWIVPIVLIYAFAATLGTTAWGLLIIATPLGILSGYVGYRLDKKFGCRTCT